MAYESATNPTTGEKLFLVDNKWVPPSETATNPETGQRAFLINNEWQVLDGAPHLIAKARAVLIELSLVHLYENQHLWLEYVARLESAGFTLWALEPVFVDPKNGRTLQMDGFFVRN